MILDFFKYVYDYTESGEPFEVGEFTVFGPTGFLARRTFQGLGYLSEQQFEAIHLSSPSLTAILLTDEELAVTRAFGLTRVAANLGQAYRWYPCPPWADRSRASVVSIETMEKHSILGKTMRARVLGVCARKEERELILSVPRDKGRQLRARLTQSAPAQPLALLTGADPQANACLFWKPGMSGVNAITPPNSDGSKATGNFVAFFPEQRENDFRYIEDGFGVMLTAEAWMAVGHALESESSLSLPLSDSGLMFSIEWSRTSYVSPIESREYVADVWKTYGPGTPAENAPADTGPVVRKRIVLLTSDSELAKRTSAEDLAGYTSVMQSVVVKQFASLPRQQGQDLTIECEIEPGHKVTFRLATRPGMDHEVIRTLSGHLRALAAPNVKDGPVKFQVLYTIWGGTGAEFG